MIFNACFDHLVLYKLKLKHFNPVYQLNFNKLSNQFILESIAQNPICEVKFFLGVFYLQQTATDS